MHSLSQTSLRLHRYVRFAAGTSACDSNVDTLTLRGCMAEEMEGHRQQNCPFWTMEHIGKQWGGTTEMSEWGLEGTIIAIYIHTHALNGWLMGKQAGQSGRREGDGWALLVNTEQRIRNKHGLAVGDHIYHSLFQTASGRKMWVRKCFKTGPWTLHINMQTYAW